MQTPPSELKQTANEMRSESSIRVKRMLQMLPGILVFVALAATGVYGHRTGWQLPKFSELRASQTQADEWCSEHSVPEDECIACIPDLNSEMPDFGWCKLHGVHQCPHCHPEVAQLKGQAKFVSLPNDYLEKALGTVDRVENNLGCELYRSRIQFASTEAVQKAGIDVEPALTGPIVESLNVNGEITYDADRVAHISTRADGIAFRVYQKVGDVVQKGQILAVIDAASVGQAKASLLDALASVEYRQDVLGRIAPLVDRRAVTGARLLDEEAALRQAEIELDRTVQVMANLGLPVDLEALRGLDKTQRVEHIRFLGLEADFEKELSQQTTSTNLIPVMSTMDGIVTERHLVQGEVVNTEKMLFQVVDTSSMWLRCSVPLEDTKLLALGQAVEFRPDGGPFEVPGRISWISTDVDVETRTVEVRSELENSKGLLRNNTFGTGKIVLRTADKAVQVPSEAVQWDGNCFVVFVRDRDYFEADAPKFFYTRSVRPGVANAGKTEIIAGLLPGEIVATRGSGVLRAQILKNNLGAGCTCGH